MGSYSQEHENDVNNAWSFLAGLLFGGLVGAGTMLLMAPQSGKKTRTQIQQKSLELRDETTEAVEDALAQARAKAHQITDNVQEKAKELEKRGQAFVDEQKERFSIN
jgi:gas vesicle protein